MFHAFVTILLVGLAHPLATGAVALTNRLSTEWLMAVVVALALSIFSSILLPDSDSYTLETMLHMARTLDVVVVSSTIALIANQDVLPADHLLAVLRDDADRRDYAVRGRIPILLLALSFAARLVVACVLAPATVASICVLLCAALAVSGWLPATPRRAALQFVRAAMRPGPLALVVMIMEFVLVAVNLLIAQAALRHAAFDYATAMQCALCPNNITIAQR
ncbi:hypothetical protein EXIGLDRAFT_777883 [Exidia glandulosa HHB12029]|uniref:TRP C-terminal domain-containing protein n=1 Tax=Exidia glandulosa HHB12029 TaxID=1314781 RepID=A0A165CTN4_EXIGL|nr:hypothetical protein EXIGLDRAFT_777883 [Exidia glandulosa HHB12029]